MLAMKNYLQPYGLPWHLSFLKAVADVYCCLWVHAGQLPIAKVPLGCHHGSVDKPEAAV